MQVDREHVTWRTNATYSGLGESFDPTLKRKVDCVKLPVANPTWSENSVTSFEAESVTLDAHPAPSGRPIRLYEVAHSRAGDKGNDINFSIIPHFPGDIMRLKMLITAEWVKRAVAPLLRATATSLPNSSANTETEKEAIQNLKIEIYEVKGVHALNVVVRNILDGGVNCSRRIDRHGKTISDLILNQQIILP